MASEGKPGHSMSAGCDPSQVKEFNEMYRKAGIKCATHLADGTLEYTSRKARSAVLKSRNLLDKDAGYGDWAGH
jgi:hypothetical protein